MPFFYNPKSGGGRREKFHLAEGGAGRGIELTELTFEIGSDAVWFEAVAGSADALATAGHGSQAVVAVVAAELTCPMRVPAGTCNHFALARQAWTAMTSSST